VRVTGHVAGTLVAESLLSLSFGVDCSSGYAAWVACAHLGICWCVVATLGRMHPARVMLGAPLDVACETSQGDATEPRLCLEVVQCINFGVAAHYPTLVRATANPNLHKMYLCNIVGLVPVAGALFLGVLF
jgi:hypothetical protein